MLVFQCKPCFDFCIGPNFRIFPWSTNIDICVDDASCAFGSAGIARYCSPLAQCMQDCASTCLNSCLSDKYHALWSSLTSLVLLWLAWAVLPCCAGLVRVTVGALAIISLIPMVGATILLGDLWRQNMYGTGWQYLQDETFKNVTPNHIPVVIVCLLLIGDLLMMLAYFNIALKIANPVNTLKRVAKPRVAEPAKEQGPTAMAFIPTAPEVKFDKPKEYDVTVGIEFGLDPATGEVRVERVYDTGPAFVCAPKLLEGDVVHKVWDEKDPEPVAGKRPHHTLVHQHAHTRHTAALTRAPTRIYKTHTATFTLPRAHTHTATHTHTLPYTHTHCHAHALPLPHTHAHNPVCSSPRHTCTQWPDREGPSLGLPLATPRVVTLTGTPTRAEARAHTKSLSARTCTQCPLRHGTTRPARAHAGSRDICIDVWRVGQM